MVTQRFSTTRYQRQLILPGFGSQGQEKLRQAKVLIVGLGGLGSPVAYYLAAAGVGTLGLADYDQVAEENLHRQIIYREKQVGQWKIASAKETIQSINSAVECIPHPEGVQLSNAMSLLQQYDLVVDASDNFNTRYLVNDTCVLLKKPYVYGSIHQFEGQVTIFGIAAGPCYRCLYPEPPRPGEIPNCAEAGVLGAICGIVGSFQAAETIKWIVGLGQPIAGRLLYIDSLHGEQRTIRIKKDPDCPICGNNPRITGILPDNYPEKCQMMSTSPIPLQLSVTEVDRLIKENPNKILLLDVREEDELHICRLKDSLHIPSGEIATRYTELPKEQYVIVYCHHGMRSLRVTEFLRKKGWLTVSNMMGGIDAWARQVEPQMPRY